MTGVPVDLIPTGAMGAQPFPTVVDVWKFLLQKWLLIYFNIHINVIISNYASVIYQTFLVIPIESK